MQIESSQRLAERALCRCAERRAHRLEPGLCIVAIPGGRAGIRESNGSI